jgi:hypothetical protein
MGKDLGLGRVLNGGDDLCGDPGLPGRRLCSVDHRPECYQKNRLFEAYTQVRSLLEQTARELFGCFRTPTALPSL